VTKIGVTGTYTYPVHVWHENYNIDKHTLTELTKISIQKQSTA